MEFEKVMRGVINYIRGQMMPTMNSWQRILAETAIIRADKNRENVKKAMLNNSFLQIVGFTDSDNKIDIDGTIRDMRDAFTKVPTIELEIPLFGKYKFTREDLDKLYQYIMEG